MYNVFERLFVCLFVFIFIFKGLSINVVYWLDTAWPGGEFFVNSLPVIIYLCNYAKYQFKKWPRLLHVSGSPSLAFHIVPKLLHDRVGIWFCFVFTSLFDWHSEHFRFSFVTSLMWWNRRTFKWILTEEGKEGHLHF